MGVGVRDVNKGISSYGKAIFKNQHFSCICLGGFFLSFFLFFLGKISWNEFLRLSTECSLSCSFSYIWIMYLVMHIFVLIPET